MQSANPFRVRAYQNAARNLRRYGREASDMLAAGEDLSELEGIGEDLAGKIRDLAETGTTDLYDELSRQTPKLAFELLQLPGMGPKRVHTLIDELRVKTLAQLRKAAREGRVRALSGFGEKSEAELLAALEGLRRPSPKASYAASPVPSASRRRTLAEVQPRVETILARLRAAPGVVEIAIAGSYRRGRESVGDLDFVVGAANGRRVVETFTGFSEVKEILGAGATRATIVLKSGLQADLRVVNPESFGAALLYLTGSKPHNVALRGRARARGLKLNEYGLYRGARKIASQTEADIYGALGLAYISPELREARGEIEAATKNALPRLISRADIKGDLVVRGGDAATLDAARDRGLSYLALVTPTGGKTPSAPQSNMPILHAVEVSIDAAGYLQADDNSLTKADFVVAAIETDFALSRTVQTERILKAITHPKVAMFAHPTCRLIGRRDPIDADWPRILRAAADLRVALQLSGDPDRLDLTDFHCRMAREAGAMVALSSDAREATQLAWMDFALLQARRGWLEAANVLNVQSVGQVEAWLKSPQPSRRRPS